MQAETKKPFITVVTCTYNSEKYLEKTLNTVLNQDFYNIEHIINDSYSSDSTLDIIDQYIKTVGNKYKVVFFKQNLKVLQKR